jgi:hypothetical protein
LLCAALLCAAPCEALLCEVLSAESTGLSLDANEAKIAKTGWKNRFPPHEGNSAMKN